MRIVFLTYALHHSAQTGRHGSTTSSVSDRRPRDSLLAPMKVPVPGDVLEDMESLTRSVEVFETGVARSAARLERRRAYRAAMGRMRTELVRLHAADPFDVAVLHSKRLLPVWKGTPRAPARCGHLRCGLDAHIRQRAATVPLRKRPLLHAYAAAVLRRERGLGTGDAVRVVHLRPGSQRRRRSATGAVLILNGVDPGTGGAGRLCGAGRRPARPGGWTTGRTRTRSCRGRGAAARPEAGSRGRGGDRRPGPETGLEGAL